jgi:predicted nucleic acid-binding protein
MSKIFWITFATRAGIKRSSIWRPCLSDPDDDHVLEVAVAGRCDGIVTFNLRDFAGTERFGLWIETPKDFLNRIGALP